MKAHILNRKLLHQLFDHILDGFDRSEQGIELAYSSGVISKEEYIELLKMNASRLRDRISEFKIINRLVSIFFAGLFLMMQINGDDLEMRRPTRTGRSISRSGRRRNDDVQPQDFAAQPQTPQA